MRARFSLVPALCIFACCSAIFAQNLPDPKAGGKDGGPQSILFLSPSPQLDKTYTAKLAEAGYSFTTLGLYTPIPYDTFKRFNVIVIDKLPIAAEQYNTFGQKMLVYWENMKRITRCLEEGAGVLVYADIAGEGPAGLGGWNDEMRRWGIGMKQGCILDRSLLFEKWLAYGENG